MKDFFKVIFVVVCIMILFGICVQGIFLVIGPDYKEGEYTMTYRVYYSNTPKEYTITNNWPISIDSYRGTNSVIKTVKTPYTIKMFSGKTVFVSSAPIEVVDYTFKEK